MIGYSSFTAGDDDDEACCGKGIYFSKLYTYGLFRLQGTSHLYVIDFSLPLSLIAEILKSK